MNAFPKISPPFQQQEVVLPAFNDIANAMYYEYGINRRSCKSLNSSCMAIRAYMRVCHKPLLAMNDINVGEANMIWQTGNITGTL